MEYGICVSPGNVEEDGEGEGGQHVEGDQAVLPGLQQPALVRLREAHRLQTKIMQKVGKLPATI